MSARLHEMIRKLYKMISLDARLGRNFATHFGSRKNVNMSSVNIPHSIQPAGMSRSEFLRLCVDVVDANINQGVFEAEAISKSMGLSLFQFRNHLLEITGLTPKVFIEQRRMELARWLLTTHNHLRIKAIANKCGYGDAPNFTRAFKRNFGITPSAFIKQQKNSGTLE